MCQALCWVPVVAADADLPCSGLSGGPWGCVLTAVQSVGGTEGIFTIQFLAGA